MGRQPKSPEERRRRFTVSLDANTDYIVQRLVKLTNMPKSQIICWAIRHLWNDIQAEGIDE